MFNSTLRRAIVLFSVCVALSCCFKLMPPPPPPPPVGNGAPNHLDWDANAKDEVFYDVIYDDLEECPVKGNAVPNSAFYGSVFKVNFATSHAECMLTCHRESRCRSINVQLSERRSQRAESREKQFICQLNEFNQYNSPFLLINRPGVVYYEDIHCDNKRPQQLVDSQSSRIFEPIIKVEQRHDAKISESDRKFKLNRLLLLEKVMKMFQKQQTID